MGKIVGSLKYINKIDKSSKNYKVKKRKCKLPISGMKQDMTIDAANNQRILVREYNKQFYTQNLTT